MAVQVVSIFFIFNECFRAGDTNVALRDLGNLSVSKKPKDPSTSNLAIVLNPSILGSPKASVSWPFLCVVTLEAAMSNLSIHSSQEESINGHAKRDTHVYHQII